MFGGNCNMHWLTILFIGIAANLDNLGIGVSYSLKSTRIPFVSNLLIAVVSMVAAYLSITAGSLVSQFISLSIANFVGGFLLIFLGFKCIIESFKQEKETATVAVHSNSKMTKVMKEPDALDLNNDKVISWKESILLGLALAINCLALGLGAGITGVSPLFATISIGIFSILTIAGGTLVGSKLCDSGIGKYSNLAAGLMLVLIGIYEIIF
jgi:putative sporulation protein YtaF